MLNKIWNNKFKGIISALFLLIGIFIDKFSSKINTFVFLSNIKKYGSNCKIMRGVYCRYPNFIEFGNNIIIGNNSRLSTEFSNKHYFILEDNVSIGQNCSIDFSGGILIKKGAHIAHDILISTHDHGFDYRNKPIGKALEIGENAFIGSKSIIMHNCNYIGKNAVVGTGSVVTKDVPDYAVVAGNPAKIIKYIN